MKYMTRILAVAGGFYAAAYCSIAQAQVSTGGNGANTVVQAILSALKGLGLGIATIAIMVAAFGMLFQGKTWKDVAVIAVGGILFGSAPWIAGLITGTST